MIKTIKKLFGFNSPEIDYAMLVRQGAILLDVRSTGEFAMRHIEGAINIPVDDLDSSLDTFKNKNTPIIACCASGGRSALAKNILRMNGFSHVYNGGAWKKLANKIH
jgi:phage shock protein E